MEKSRISEINPQVFKLKQLPEMPLERLWIVLNFGLIRPIIFHQANLSVLGIPLLGIKGQKELGSKR